MTMEQLKANRAKLETLFVKRTKISAVRQFNTLFPGCKMRTRKMTEYPNLFEIRVSFNGGKFQRWASCCAGYGAIHHVAYEMFGVDDLLG